ncbi:Adenosine receptor A3 [Bulinus truncatus]|nr:Adenosine receptor A3 [Bulinus truncatus]
MESDRRWSLSWETARGYGCPLGDIMAGATVAFNFDLQDSIYLSAEIIIGIFAVCGNSLVLTTIFVTRGLHTATNMFLCNLAAADLCVGMLVAPCAILAHYGIPAHFYGCVFINCIMMVFSDVSILTLFVIAVERFFAIKQPFIYQRVLTMQVAHRINMLVWVAGAGVGLAPMFGWQRPYKEIHFCRLDEVITPEYMVYVQFFGVVLTSLVAMTVSYVYIFVVVRRHIHQIDAIRDMLNLPQDANFQRSYRRDLKTARTLAVVLVLFCHCWLPFCAAYSVKLFCSFCLVPYPMLLVTTVLSHANSCINPLVYSTGNSAIRAAMWKLLFSDSIFDYAPGQGSGEMISRRQTIHPTSLRHKSSHSMGYATTATYSEPDVSRVESRKCVMQFADESDVESATIY